MAILASVCPGQVPAQTKAGALPRLSFASCGQVLRAPVASTVSFAVGVTVGADGTASNWRVGLGKGRSPDLEAEVVELLKFCKFVPQANMAPSAPYEKRLHVFVAPAKLVAAGAGSSPGLRCSSSPEYPAAALRANEQGVAEVDVHVNADASLALADIATSTGSRWLDVASLPDLDACQFMPAADGDGQAKAGSGSYRKVWRNGPIAR